VGATPDPGIFDKPQYCRSQRAAGAKP